MKTWRLYKKVKIFRLNEPIPGSDFKITKDNRIVSASPKYTIWYCWSNGAKCETLKELKQDIDSFLKECLNRGISPTEAVTTLNS